MNYNMTHSVKFNNLCFGLFGISTALRLESSNKNPKISRLLTLCSFSYLACYYFPLLVIPTAVLNLTFKK
jgi:hypothetical protein